MKLVRTFAVSSATIWLWCGIGFAQVSVDGRIVLPDLGAAEVVVPLEGSIPSPPGTSTNVEIIVNASLYGSGAISAALNQYISDVRIQGYNPIVTATTFANAADLRSHLATTYTSVGLAGAVLIGDQPAEHFERNGQYSDPCWYERFACDLYYGDLNGTWSDATGNGTYDTHAGDARPEIWIGRMTTSPLVSLHGGRSEASLLNTYLQKNHAYRTGQLSVPSRGLAYIDDDWIPWASEWAGNLAASVSGAVTKVSDGATTVATDYKSRLSTEYESMLLAAHSSEALHAFKIGSSWSGGYVYNDEIAALDPQVLFYNLFCCSNADYESSGYMGGEYVFGTSKGLLAVGSTKTGSMLDFGYYYNPLGQGKIFGQGLLEWWQTEYAGGYGDSDKDWFYGMTLIGDPLLRTQEFVPEPAALSLLVLGAIGLLRRRH